MNSRRIRLNGTAAALGLVLLLGAAGCTGDDDPAPTPTASQTADPTADAVAAAEDAMQAYLDAQPQLTANPNAPAVDPSTVATGQALVGLNALIDLYKNNGWTSTGNKTFASIETFSVDLEGSPDTSPPVDPNIVFNTCIDASNSYAVDSSGNSVTPEDRVVRGQAQITVSEIGDSWIVSNELSSGQPCE